MSDLPSAENPDEFTGLHIGHIRQEAVGVPAIIAAMRNVAKIGRAHV